MAVIDINNKTRKDFEISSEDTALVHNNGMADVVEVHGEASAYDNGLVRSGAVIGGRVVAYGYGSAILTTVNNTGELYVSQGGYAADITVADQGNITVFDGGLAEGVTVSNAGSMFVHKGGSAQNNHVSGGTAFIASGGTAHANHLSGGGLLTVMNGGLATDNYLSAGGSLFVRSGGVAASTTVSSGGSLTVDPAGTANVITVNSGGRVLISSGGTANDVTLASSARVNVSQGAVVNRTAVNINGILVVSDGGLADSTTVNGKGSLRVNQGGIAKNSVVNSNGYMHVSGGGTASDTIVNSGGELRVSGGGIARSTAVSSGGSMIVFSSGTVRDTVVSSGGKMHISGGSAGLLTVKKAGAVFISSGTVADFLSIENYGSAYIEAGAKVTGAVSISRDAVVSAFEGSVVDADISTFAPGAAARIAGISVIDGSPDLTITVSASQTPGDYAIATGASSTFSKNFTVVTDTGATLGTVSVGGVLNAGGYSYCLNLASNALTLTVSEAASGVTGDLNADGRADIVMTIDQSSHPADGATGAWLIQNDQTASWDDLSTRNAGWVIFGTGKTASGKSTDDVYIRSADNVIGAWTTGDSGQVTGWETVGQFDANTQILGLGDFNGNGQTDLLLRNVNGAVGCFFTGGEKTGWNYFQSLGDEWQISAVGDFNGDGRDDLVLVHDAGFAGTWLTQENGTMVWADLDTVSDGFSVVGAGDFDGDGVDDVLLKNGNYYGAWLVQNGNAKAWFGIGDLGDVTVEQVSDFDGDGVDDLRVRTTAGDLGSLLVRGEDSLEWHYYGSVGDEWSTHLAAI